MNTPNKYETIEFYILYLLILNNFTDLINVCYSREMLIINGFCDVVIQHVVVVSCGVWEKKE
jgi:hypothetical protein